MPQTELEFFETAIQLSGSINASSLARKLDVDPTALSQWKKGKSYPSDKTMLKIALLCDLDPVEALALLNLWRCNEDAKGVYQSLLSRVQSSALKCFPYIITGLVASQAYFSEMPIKPEFTRDNPVQKSADLLPKVIIMRFLWKLSQAFNRSFLFSFTVFFRMPLTAQFIRS